MPDPHMRLVTFRQQHPGVVIERAEFDRDRWEARTRDSGGYWKPRPLPDLLDALEEELDSAPP